MSNHVKPAPSALAKLHEQLAINSIRVVGLRRMYAIAAATPGLEAHAADLVHEIAEIEQDSSVIRREALEAGDLGFGWARPSSEWVLTGPDGEVVASGPIVEVV